MCHMRQDADSHDSITSDSAVVLRPITIYGHTSNCKREPCLSGQVKEKTKMPHLKLFSTCRYSIMQPGCPFEGVFPHAWTNGFGFGL